MLVAAQACRSESILRSALAIWDSVVKPFLGASLSLHLVDSGLRISWVLLESQVPEPNHHRPNQTPCFSWSETSFVFSVFLFLAVVSTRSALSTGIKALWIKHEDQSIKNSSLRRGIRGSELSEERVEALWTGVGKWTVPPAVIMTVLWHWWHQWRLKVLVPLEGSSGGLSDDMIMFCSLQMRFFNRRGAFKQSKIESEAILWEEYEWLLSITTSGSTVVLLPMQTSYGFNNQESMFEWPAHFNGLVLLPRGPIA